ncbi:preprotein translocase subunit SecE [Roseofilum casamattae]|uniref:Protein translocase subunit SecE n=1 Tax=Roseofilum casamattae BLCC-M143 TaxID=3022442 RepID=A0ABT7C2T3_9CYAN|nr:preprotein translocase subunit SecE [Roseofilum casamattae]MDJ1185600.1 preprotein translocase subunit SecE [Roseofilum casamattae BLCC-M143]
MAKKETAPAQEKSENLLEFSSKFLQGTKDELQKVVWPSRQQLISESVAVMSMVSLFAFLIFAVDKLFIWTASQVF